LSRAVRAGIVTPPAVIGLNKEERNPQVSPATPRAGSAAEESQRSMELPKQRRIATVTIPHPAVRAPEPPPILALLGACLAPFVVMLIVALILAAIKNAITPAPPAPPTSQVAPSAVAARPAARPGSMGSPHALALRAPASAWRVTPSVTPAARRLA